METKKINNKFSLSALLFSIFINSAWAVLPATHPCKETECSQLLNRISGGSSTVLAFELVGLTLVTLYVVVRVYDRWFK
jgi:hypothetical protein